MLVSKSLEPLAPGARRAAVRRCAQVAEAALFDTSVSAEVYANTATLRAAVHYLLNEVKGVWSLDYLAEICLATNLAFLRGVYTAGAATEALAKHRRLDALLCGASFSLRLNGTRAGGALGPLSWRQLNIVQVRTRTAVHVRSVIV